MNLPLIDCVKDNKDKQQTYAYWKSRYKLAMREEFYVEALMIDYALMEDRLNAILFHSGVLPNRQTLKMKAGTTKNLLRQILAEYGNFKEPVRVNLTNITGKIKCLQAVLAWVEKCTGDYEENRYLKTLKNQYESCEIDGLEECLQDITDWCKYRNEIIHAAFNKNVSSLSENFRDRAIEGFQLANYLDAQERIIKKGNRIRKAANLSIK